MLPAALPLGLEQANIQKNAPLNPISLKKSKITFRKTFAFYRRFFYVMYRPAMRQAAHSTIRINSNG